MNQNVLAPDKTSRQDPFANGRDKVTPFKYERQLGIEQSSQLLETEAAHTLSIVATANDVCEAVRILKKRPDGVSLADAMDTFKKRILNPQKIAAYEYWGILVRNGDRLSLTPLGWELARRLEPERTVFRTVLNSIIAYRSMLEWIHERHLERVTHTDVIAYWSELDRSVVYAGRENAIKMNAISFLHLCQAAELGTVTLGKKGQPSRLLIDREELEMYISAPPCSLTTSTAEEVDAVNYLAMSRLSGCTTAISSIALLSGAEKRCVFISCKERSWVVEQVQTLLSLAELESEVTERGETGSALLTEQMRQVRRSSVAGIVVLTTADCERDETGSAGLNEGVMMAIGATCASCDNRVVLLREKGLTMPDILVDLKHCEFQGSSLSWESGVQLMQTIKDWEKSR